MRLDIRLSETKDITRNKAQSFIKDGLVTVDGKIIIKPSFEVNGNEIIELKEEKKVHWVSRSAGKLDGFLEQLQIQNIELQVAGARCLDVGSSTGGFTQVLIQRGANHVDAVDVGTDQLHSTIKTHPRVQSHEQIDIRNFKSESIYDIIVCDASFISLEDILASILKFANEDTNSILLWKPQFEVGRKNLRKTGVPKDEETVKKKQLEWEFFLCENNCKILQKEKSTVLGEAGNVEWLYLIKKMEKMEK
ncbi:MAG: TlyA family rRNA (cytidine-2'-O)-methyltransferase [Candidatus Altimarinota bacterium]